MKLYSYVVKSIGANLKPCPFCGSEQLKIYFEEPDGRGSGKLCVFCQECEAELPVLTGNQEIMRVCAYEPTQSSMNELERRWNRRSPCSND